MKQQDVHFPFGLFPVDSHEETCHLYAEVIPILSEAYPLPPILPSRHPLLQQLEGRFPIHDTLPPWWYACADALVSECPALHSLLSTLSREEFRRGSIDQHRWKAWRTAQYQSMTDQEKSQHRWRKGPSLYWLMDEVLPLASKSFWLERWVNRGSREMPKALDLVITSAPEWWLNMSNGRGWCSCMGTGDDRNPRIIGNWYDSGVMLAAVVARGVDCWTPDCLIARCTFRLVWDAVETGEEYSQVRATSLAPRIVLGRIYHNDFATACNLIAHLIAKCEARRMSWGCIAGTNTAQFIRNGSIGPVVMSESSCRALGLAYWHPAQVEEPYLDGEAHFREPVECSEEGSWSYPLLAIYPCRLPEQGHRSLPANSVSTCQSEVERVGM